MDQRTKYTKVKTASPFGGYHRTFDALWGAVPAEAKRQCTAATLVRLINTMRRQWDLGADHARHEASDDLILYHGGHKYRLSRELEAS